MGSDGNAGGRTCGTEYFGFRPVPTPSVRPTWFDKRDGTAASVHLVSSGVAWHGGVRLAAQRYVASDATTRPPARRGRARCRRPCRWRRGPAWPPPQPGPSWTSRTAPGATHYESVCMSCSSCTASCEAADKGIRGHRLPKIGWCT